MSGGNPLAGCEEKLERAELHLETLKAHVGLFFEGKPDAYRIVSEVDKKASRFVGRVKIAREPPLPWSVIVGDYLHNLRCVLDHLMRQLVIANGERPTYNNAFPLFDQEPPEDASNGERARWEGNVEGVSADALRFVQFCQPYNALDGDPGAHTLAGLRRLSNQDKHRTLVPALCAVHGAPELFKIDLIRYQDVLRPTGKITVHAGRPLKDNDVVFESPITITGPDPIVETDGKAAVDIGFGSPPVAMKGLEQMSQAVNMVLRNCRRFIDS